MFLDLVRRRNPQLIEAAVELHRQGVILPDTYVLDLDIIVRNAKMLLKQAKDNQIELFYMGKQFGRNPLISRKIYEAGIEKAVVVDFKEALTLMEEGLPLGNVGHLVQIPHHLLKRVMTYGSDYLTVYSIEMVEKINRVAEELGIKQRLLMRVITEGDNLYEGQYGGFQLESLPKFTSQISEMSHVEIAGVTSFPCFLFDDTSNQLEFTHNVKTLQQAKRLLQESGLRNLEVNVPSATSCQTLPLIKKIGGTQGEPGHALTGTTPYHAKHNLEELPGFVYLSEVSHHYKNNSCVYGGGYYRRGHLENALVIGKEQTASITKVNPINNESIDYYLELTDHFPIGAAVIMAFRTQIFVTRSDVAVVSGIQTGQMKLEGIFDSQGHQIRR